MKPTFKFGYIPDARDGLDFQYLIPFHLLSRLPPSASVANRMPSVGDQGKLGSCVGNGVANCIHYCFTLQQEKDKFVPFHPSRLMIYYMAREMEGTVGEDCGCQIRDAIKSVAKEGVCPEEEWPYDISRFTERPNAKCYSHALQHQVIRYERIPVELTALKSCIAEGFPFVFGARVYESTMSDDSMKTGDRPYPSWWERMGRGLGGHCEVACGYDDATERFLIEGSWGTEVGKNGYFTYPYEYLSNPDLTHDCWKITMVEENGEFSGCSKTKSVVA